METFRKPAKFLYIVFQSHNLAQEIFSAVCLQILKRLACVLESASSIKLFVSWNIYHHLPKIMADFTHKWNIMKQLPQNHGNVQVICCFTKRCFHPQNPRSLKFLRLEVGMLWSTVAKVQSVLRTWQGQKKFEGIRRFCDFSHIHQGASLLLKRKPSKAWGLVTLEQIVDGEVDQVLRFEMCTSWTKWRSM